MKKIVENLKLLVLIAFIMTIYSCSTSKVVLSHGVDISKYSYVYMSDGTGKGTGKLNDVMLEIKNAIAMTKLIVVSEQEALAKIIYGEAVLEPEIEISSGTNQTDIMITFYDAEKNKVVLILKGVGKEGFSKSHDQNLAVKAIKNKLKNIFGEKITN